MKVYKIGSLSDWETVAQDDLRKYHCEPEGRDIWLRFNTNVPVEVLASDNADSTGEVLIAAASGLFDVRWTANADQFVRVAWKGKDGRVMLSGRARDHSVQKVAEEVFTIVDRDREKKSPDLESIMKRMLLNEQRRDRQVANELAAIREERDAERVAAEKAAVAAKEVSDGQDDQEPDDGPDPEPKPDPKGS